MGKISPASKDTSDMAITLEVPDDNGMFMLYQKKCSCSIAVLLIVTTLLCFSSLSLFCFRYLEEQWFWVVFLWSSLRILFVKFLGLVGLYRGIRLVFFWLLKGVSWGFLWLVFVVVFLFQKILWEFFSVDFLWHLAKNFKSCVLFAMRF